MVKSFAILAALAFACMLPHATAQSADISGQWHFVIQTEGGERTANPTFQLEGQNVTGKWDKADVKGTFSNGQLDLSFPYTSEEAGPGTLKIKGQLKDGTLIGTWEFQDYTGSFKASRASSAS
jgi:hypothetical protein